MTFVPAPYLLPHLALAHETLQFVGQVAVFATQLVVSGAVLLDLSLDFCQHHLEVAGHLRPLLLFLPAVLHSLFLEGEEGDGKGLMEGGKRGPVVAFTLSSTECY